MPFSFLSSGSLFDASHRKIYKKMVRAPDHNRPGSTGCSVGPARLPALYLLSRHACKLPGTHNESKLDKNGTYQPEAKAKLSSGIAG